MELGALPYVPDNLRMAIAPGSVCSAPGESDASAGAWLSSRELSPPGCLAERRCPLFQLGDSCWRFAEKLARSVEGVVFGVVDNSVNGSINGPFRAQLGGLGEPVHRGGGCRA